MVFILDTNNKVSVCDLGPEDSKKRRWLETCVAAGRQPVHLECRTHPIKQVLKTHDFNSSSTEQIGNEGGAQRMTYRGRL